MPVPLGELRIASVKDAHIALLMEVTGARVAVVRHLYAKASERMTLRKVYAQHWPTTSSSLGSLPARVAVSAQLFAELAATTGLPEKEIERRLRSAPAARRVSAVFKQLVGTKRTQTAAAHPRIGNKRKQTTRAAAQTARRPLPSEEPRQAVAVQEPPARPTNGLSAPTSSVALFSTRHHGPHSSQLTSAVLGASFGRATRVDIASAFYDVDWVLEVLKQVPASVAQVRLIFNGLGGNRLVLQQKAFLDLERELLQRFSVAKIRLAFVPGIFHTKLFLAHGQTHADVFVGSANATRAAMSINEEVLARFKDDGAFASYFERVWTHSIALDKLEGRTTATSLIRFFRSGSLYFKPTASLQLTLNPFAALFGALPESERAKLTDFKSKYADPEPGIGAFNVSKAAEFVAPDAEPDLERASSSIKPYAVETCFGYWVPQAHEEALEERIRVASSAKRGRWDAVLRKLEGAGIGRVGQAYRAYLGEVRAHLEKHQVPYRRHLDRASDPFEASRGEEFFRRCVEALHNERFVNRLCNPFVSGSMPEIWDDPLAYGEFRDSFFGYLEYVHTREGRKSKAPNSILQTIQAPRGASANQIESLLTRHLEIRGWAPKDW